MKAADIMSTNIVTIDGLATIAEAARVMKQHHIRALIVDRTSARDAYGIITETDISRAIAQAKNTETTYVCTVMTKPCIVVNPDLAVEHIANLFTRAKILIAPVIKEKLMGIISITDILTKTNCLSPIQAQLTAQKLAELNRLSLHDSMELPGEIENDRIYDNWCSG